MGRRGGGGVHEIKYSKSEEGINHTCVLTLPKSNFSVNRLLPSSNLFWAVKRLVDYL
jgi:hypothetical protein